MNLVKKFVANVLKEQYKETYQKETPSRETMQSLEGKVFKFYGAYNSEDIIEPIRQFKLNDLVFDCNEEEIDYEYDVLAVSEISTYNPEVFSQQPLALVKVLHMVQGEFHGWNFVDVRDQHVWLKIGTNIEDGYSAYSVFEYTPKQHDETFRNNKSF